MIRRIAMSYALYQFSTTFAVLRAISVLRLAEPRAPTSLVGQHTPSRIFQQEVLWLAFLLTAILSPDAWLSARIFSRFAGLVLVAWHIAIKQLKEVSRRFKVSGSV